MCLYAISHAAAARQRYSILQHQLRSAKNARTSGHTLPFAPELSSWHRQTEVELPVGRRRRTARGRDGLPSTTQRPPPAGGSKGKPRPHQAGCTCAGKGFCEIKLGEAAPRQAAEAAGITLSPGDPLLPVSSSPNRAHGQHPAPSHTGRSHRAGRSKFSRPVQTKEGKKKKDKKKPNLTSGCWERFRSITAL